MSSVLQALSFIPPLLVTGFTNLIITLFIVGIANGFITVVVNAAATTVEIRYMRSIMSSCHGMFSIGGIVGGTDVALSIDWKD